MKARDLKTRSKHIKGSKELCKFSGKSPLSSYKTTLKQQLNGEKRWGKKNNKKIKEMES